jgi:hypothetical protein
MCTVHFLHLYNGSKVDAFKAGGGAAVAAGVLHIMHAT